MGKDPVLGARKFGTGNSGTMLMKNVMDIMSKNMPVARGSAAGLPQSEPYDPRKEPDYVAPDPALQRPAGWPAGKPAWSSLDTLDESLKLHGFGPTGKEGFVIDVPILKSDPRHPDYQEPGYDPMPPRGAVGGKHIDIVRAEDAFRNREVKRQRDWKYVQSALKIKGDVGTLTYKDREKKYLDIWGWLPE